MLKRLTKLMLLSALCGTGLALATSRVVHAPGGLKRRPVSSSVPSDRYLDLGAAPTASSAPGYSSPLHAWQSEDGRSPQVDESRYLDVARWRP
jgi:hypothetical protein